MSGANIATITVGFSCCLSVFASKQDFSLHTPNATEMQLRQRQQEAM
jgi:hypothetical protein